MTLRRIRAGDVLAGAGGVALLVVMALPWFDEDSAWSALTVLLVPLVLCALLGLVVLATTAFERSPALPITALVWLAALSVLTTLAVAVRLALPPDDAEVRPGAWLGLACVVLITLGAWWSMRDEERP